MSTKCTPKVLREGRLWWGRDTAGCEVYPAQANVLFVQGSCCQEPPEVDLRWKYAEGDVPFLDPEANTFFYLDRYEKSRVKRFRPCVPCHWAWWPMKPCILDKNLEPNWRPLHNSCEGYNPFSPGKLHPTPPRSCLARTWTFLSSTQEKKSAKRTSLGTNKGTSLGFYPKKLIIIKKKADT